MLRRHENGSFPFYCVKVIFAREFSELADFECKKSNCQKAAKIVTLQVLLSLLPKDDSTCAVGEPEPRSFLPLWPALCYFGKFFPVEILLEQSLFTSYVRTCLSFESLSKFRALFQHNLNSLM